MRGTHLVLGFSDVEIARLYFKRTYKRLRLRESHQNYTSIFDAQRTFLNLSLPYRPSRVVRLVAVA